MLKLSTNLLVRDINQFSTTGLLWKGLIVLQRYFIYFIEPPILEKNMYIPYTYLGEMMSTYKNN